MTPRPAPRRGIFEDQFWEYVVQDQLRLQRCVDCGRFRYPPGPACPGCLATKFHWEQLCGQGTLLCWTVFRRQYFPELPVPYVVAAVRTREGPILVGNLIGCGDREITHDMSVRAVFEEVVAAEGTGRICQWTPAN